MWLNKNFNVHNKCFYFCHLCSILSNFQIGYFLGSVGPSSIVHHQYVQQQHPMISRSLGSLGSSSGGTHYQQSTGSSQQHLQVMQVFVKQQQQLSRSSNTGSNGSSNNASATTITALPSAQQVNLRPIQPKPSHDDSTSTSRCSSFKDESGGNCGMQPLYQKRESSSSYHQPPLIRLPSGELISSAGEEHKYVF